MYGRFRAVMHVACRVVKERSFVSVAPYNLTGMFTRPNAIAPLHKARAICRSSRGIQTKGHEALNNLSCLQLTLFKVDLRPSARELPGIPYCVNDIRRDAQCVHDERTVSGPVTRIAEPVFARGASADRAAVLSWVLSAPASQAEQHHDDHRDRGGRGRPGPCDLRGHPLHHGVRSSPGSESAYDRKLRAGRSSGRKRDDHRNLEIPRNRSLEAPGPRGGEWIWDLSWHPSPRNVRCLDGRRLLTPDSLYRLQEPPYLCDMVCIERRSRRGRGSASRRPRSRAPRSGRSRHRGGIQGGAREAPGARATR